METRARPFPYREREGWDTPFNFPRSRPFFPESEPLANEEPDPVPRYGPGPDLQPYQQGVGIPAPPQAWGRTRWRN
jgi:hypothetical protein